ncbi:hypothetical protein GCM10011415_33540 [Salipiger pallidus]|uniref:Thioesterase domain-containing protein n=1 Tax=Salipiger pallidus TaxID=1775170 RepID=A0A8J2ZM88_9RHOB|nr:PaaI family thioesterase [Salipiger pallidus]GGG81316.1 hypothetical protein GCM10011415_33540 [Salipiger pallidus]
MTEFNEPTSAFGLHLGYDLTAWDEGFARYEMPVAAFIGNRQGLPHGGAIASLLDAAMGLCGCWPGEDGGRIHALTLSLNVQYIGQAKGARLIAEARKTGGGRSTFFAEGAVHDETGMLVAKGTGVFRYRRS